MGVVVRLIPGRWLATTLLASGVLAAPSTSFAVSQSSDARHGSASSHVTTSICNNVTGAQVSAVVGHPVPNGVLSVFVTKATKADFETSWTTSTCTYGAQTSVAASMKAVQLSYGTFSKPLTLSQMQRWMRSKATSANMLKVRTYTGLGVPAFYYSMTVSGLFGQSITAVVGNHFFGAFVDTKKVPMSQLAALATLAGHL